MRSTEMTADLPLGLAAAALIAIGVFLLRSLRNKNALVEELGSFPFAWISIAVGSALFVASYGAVRGCIYAFLAFALSGYAAVSSRIEWRTSAAARATTSLAAEPEERPTNWRRAAAKATLAIVLAGFAAFGIGEAFAIAMPMSPPDRIVIGGLLVPVLWGGGMAWTLADARLLRATIALIIIASITFAIAFLPKAFH